MCYDPFNGHEFASENGIHFQVLEFSIQKIIYTYKALSLQVSK